MPSTRHFNELPLARVTICGGFWGGRCAMNRDTAIVYQWHKLEESGSVDNFRIVAGIKKGFRRGFFYNDSDVHKCAEAAAAILAGGPHETLEKILDEYIDNIRSAQLDDGYIFTYNQFHFAGERWKNLQIEHELYTIGHLIEAGITLHDATGKSDLLELSRKAADLVVRDFSDANPAMTPGHEEIEIALIRLYRATGEKRYLETARHFLEQRGRIKFFGLRLIGQFLSQSRRSGIVTRQVKASTGLASTMAGFDFTENLTEAEPHFLKLRANLSFLTGKFFQQHRPIRKQRTPEGHAVRWGYLATAMTMLYQETGDQSILETLVQAWDHMVQRRMYVTGGIGSLPIIEGFGRDYELDNRYAYCETCAALAGIFWNREMLLATGEARYADLIEWQIYNAASVGMALDGRSYLYRNPLESEMQTRRPWYATACCPGNISRTLASLGRYIFTFTNNDIWIHQYIDSDAKFEHDGIKIRIDSGLPWDGKISILLYIDNPVEFTLHLRVPSWSEDPSLSINGSSAEFEIHAQTEIDTASGYSPYRSWYLPLRRKWGRETSIDIVFPMDTVLHRSHRRVKANRGKVALTRGPLVYCLESTDNPSVPIPKAVLDTGRAITTHHSDSHFGGSCLLNGFDPAGNILTFIPYFCWANRGQSKMQVWVQEKKLHGR